MFIAFRATISPVPTETASWWRDLLLLSLLLAVFFGQGLGHRALWHPDEGRYVEIPREMVASGDYVTPRLNGVKYFEKPVLFYWLEAAAIKAFGIKEWAMRLWPVIFAILGCLAVYVAGRKLYDRRSAWLAVAVLATTPLYYLLGRTITLDMPVSALLTLVLLAFLLGTRAPPGPARRHYFWVFYAFAALATLTKGLIGIVIPAMVIGAWILILNEWRLLKSIYLPSGLILFLLIAAPWHIAAARANPEFLHFYFIHEHFQRYLTTVHGRYEPAWFFFPVLLAGFYPWTAFLVQAFAGALPASWRALRARREELFLVLWAVLVFAFFSFSDSKLIPYILPILPPLALLVGRYLSRHWDAPAAAGLRAGTWALLVLGMVLTAVLIYLPERMPQRPRVAEYSAEFGAYAWLILGSLLATVFLPLLVSLRRRLLWTVVALVLAAGAFLVVVDRGVALLDDKRSVKQLALDLKTRLQPGDAVMTYREYYQDLPVYLGRTVTVVDWKGELEFGMEIEDTSRWMIGEAAFWQRWNGPQRAYLLTGRSNYDKLHAQEPDRFRLLAQTGSNVLVTNRAP
jgi:4-amino-4-deoxy-L-arabinose transferase-like glycosyltransferase